MTKMQSILLLIILGLAFSGVLSLDVALNEQWRLWKQTNSKHYSGAEGLIRRNIWEENLKKVREHNLQADLGIYTYWLGMNKYADMTIDEFVKGINHYNVSRQQQPNCSRESSTFNSGLQLPDTVDWRTKGYVTPVKDQGQLGSTAAFSATGAVEGQFFNATGRLVSLSEANLIDCVPAKPCTPFVVDDAFKYIIKNGGIDSEGGYPIDNRCICRFQPAGSGAKISRYCDVASRDENALQQAVATVGPISVAIDASHSSFQLYKSGVYNELRCSQTQLDHAVLVVGYGMESSTPYWLVKNSWGTSWGMRGYIWMARNQTNQCGIATMASYPLV